MDTRRIQLLFSFLAISLLSIGQDFNPGEDEIFIEDEVTEIRITMSKEDKDFLLAEENRESGQYVSAKVTLNNSKLQSVSVTNVGVRLRGNTARFGPKRSFKIDFKEFGGEQFYKYKKLNLKPNTNDPAHVRELLSMHMFKLMDVPAPRVAPSALYLNDEYMGVYLILEQIDDEFVDKRFGMESGFLYKCKYSASLSNDGQIFNGDLYESKMNEEFDTRSELSNFVTVLNNTSDAQFKTEIEKVFEVDRYIRYMAVEAIIGHWDGYSYLNNNYYLYYDADEGDKKFEFIAYDTDNTWGIDWVNRDWATRDLTHFYRHNNPRPLSSRILTVPEYRNRYYAYLNQLFTNYFTSAYLYPKFDQLKSLLSSYVSSDVRFDDAWGFTHQDFLSSFDYASEQHVEYGLRDFVATRRNTGIGSFPLVILVAEKTQDYEVYPNPSRDGYLSLTGPNMNDVQIEVLDIFGRSTQTSILKKSNSESELYINAPGLYFIKIDEQVKRVLIR